jgi:PAS domain S-box-containing protein
LAQQLTSDAQSLLTTLTQLALALCQADSVGISLLETTPTGEAIFRWVELSGSLANWQGQSIPYDYSPCHTTLHTQQPQLYRYPERYFTYLQHPQYKFAEVLLIPLLLEQQPLGTIWIMTHHEDHHFDLEDQRILTNLSGFTVAALTHLRSRQRAEALLAREQAARQAVDQAANRVIDILEKISDCFVALDHDWRITAVNQVTAKLNNLTPAAMIGKTHWEMWVWSVGTIVEQNYRQAVATGVPVEFEVLYEPLQMWLEIRAYPTADGLNLFFRDMTERKKRERQLQERTTLLERAQQVGKMGHWTYDLLTQEMVWSPQARRIFVADSPFELTYESAASLVHPADLPHVLAATEAAVSAAYTGERSAQKSDLEVEYRILRPDGVERTVFLEGNFDFDGVGQPTRIFGIVVDITDRKQAEAALQQSEERSRTILESIDDGFVALDENWTFTYVNHKSEQLLGYQAENLLGQNFWEAFPLLAGSDLEQMHRRVMRDRVAASLTAFYLEHNRWYDVRSYPAVNGITIYFRDVSDLMALEQERDHLLQQEQAAREAAEVANRVKDEFLAVLSHELRSPLNPILGWTRLLQTGKLDATRQIEALKTIERNAKLQTQLIEDLLDISRIMRGKLSLNVAPVQLTFVITAAIETVQLAAAAKQIAIKLDLDSTVMPVLGDVGRLQQVVWNLLTNAVKFTPEDGHITIELRQVDGLAQLRVIDTGKGIRPDFLPQVFEYFRQEDSSITRKFGGLGLGLAIVRQIVEMHGGTVDAESSGENQGSVFSVQLPVCVQPELTPAAVAQTRCDIQSLRDVQVLVVDDEADTRSFQAFVLEQSGATVITAASAFEALQIIERQTLDILVSDIGMPGMNGYELIQHVRSRPAELGGNVPAIALTAYAGEWDQRQALQAGFQKHLSKPVEPEELIQAITNLVRPHTMGPYP